MLQDVYFPLILYLRR